MVFLEKFNPLSPLRPSLLPHSPPPPTLPPLPSLQHWRGPEPGQCPSILAKTSGPNPAQKAPREVVQKADFEQTNTSGTKPHFPSRIVAETHHGWPWETLDFEPVDVAVGKGGIFNEQNVNGGDGRRKRGQAHNYRSIGRKVLMSSSI